MLYTKHTWNDFLVQNSKIENIHNATITLQASVSEKISVTEGSISYCGKQYGCNLVFDASNSIAVGELKWATVSPPPKERMSGIVVRTSDTKPIGAFQVTNEGSFGSLWVYLDTAISNTNAVCLSATGFTK